MKDLLIKLIKAQTRIDINNRYCELQRAKNKNCDGCESFYGCKKLKELESILGVAEYILPIVARTNDIKEIVSFNNKLGKQMEKIIYRDEHDKDLEKKLIKIPLTKGKD